MSPESPDTLALPLSYIRKNSLLLARHAAQLLVQAVVLWPLPVYIPVHSLSIDLPY